VSAYYLRLLLECLYHLSVLVLPFDICTVRTRKEATDSIFLVSKYSSISFISNQYSSREKLLLDINVGNFKITQVWINQEELR
jgi:hypothetical protein